MYLHNKYTRIYFLIIERAKSRTLDSYSESHHIIPKSLGGTNSVENLVQLTSKEHFICHRLLTKMTEGESKRKMCYAMKIMTSDRHSLRYIPTSRTFEYVREQARQAQIGVPLSKERRENIRKALTGKTLPEKTKQKMREAHKHRPAMSQETKNKIGNSNKGRTQSQETINKIKEARANQVIVTVNVTCPHCGKVGGNRIMPRYHFDNCKFNTY